MLNKKRREKRRGEKKNTRTPRRFQVASFALMQLKEVRQPMPESDDGRTEMTYVRSSTVHDDTQRKKKKTRFQSRRSNSSIRKHFSFFFSQGAKKKRTFTLLLVILSLTPCCPVSLTRLFLFLFTSLFFFRFFLLQLPFYKSLVPSAASLSLFFFSPNLPRHTRQIKKKKKIIISNRATPSYIFFALLR